MKGESERSIARTTGVRANTPEMHGFEYQNDNLERRNASDTVDIEVKTDFHRDFASRISS
jgi:hypothetical protein